MKWRNKYKKWEISDKPTSQKSPYTHLTYLCPLKLHNCVRQAVNSCKRINYITRESKVSQTSRLFGWLVEYLVVVNNKWIYVHTYICTYVNIYCAFVTSLQFVLIWHIHMYVMGVCVCSSQNINKWMT